MAPAWRARAATAAAAAAAATVHAVTPPYYPVVADAALDCAVRAAAWNFSRALQPERGDQRPVFDALQLGAYCGLAPPPGPADAARAAPRSRAASPPGFFCDALAGSDANPGTLQQPFASVARGVAACRAVSAAAAAGGGGGCAVTLRDSAPFVLGATLALTAADSGLTLAAYPGEAPVLTGALPLVGLDWAPVGGGGGVWVARGLRLPQPPGVLFVNGTRAVRARWPNCDPEACLVPDGYTNATAWLPPAPPAGAPRVVPGNASRAFDVFFPNYTWAEGGVAVGRFEPPEGYWVHPHPPGGSTCATPAGFSYDPRRFSPRARAWANASTGVVSVFHGEYWGNWLFPIAAHDGAAGRVEFGPGGWQEARGWPVGGALFVENILEELDAPGEWFWDAAAGDLYLWPNGTAPGEPPPRDGGVSAGALESLLSLTGTPAAPVTGVTLRGLTFTGTQPTFLARPFRAPSGGDWSFADSAALVAAGTAGLLVDGCVLDRLGGNGLLLRGWNRFAAVMNSTFTRLGDSAIVTAGFAAGQDLSAGDAPVGTLVSGCLFAELGVHVKQAGALYSALSANTTFTRNVAFNLPRAAVNFNDGAWGGHVVARNLFFNTVRETADHGALNTWDREPYVQPGRTQPDGSPVLVPAPTYAVQNLLVNSYYAIHPLDHDDGSNGMVDVGNVLAFAGTKNFEGFNKTSVGNLVVRPDFASGGGSGDAGAAAGGRWAPHRRVNAQGQPVTPDGVPLPVGYYFPACARSVGQAAWGAALADVYANNTCLLNSTASPYLFGACDAAAPSSDGRVPLASGNTFLTPGGGYTLACGGKQLDLAQAQAAGYDVGSVARDGRAISPEDVGAMILRWLGA